MGTSEKCLFIGTILYYLKDEEVLRVNVGCSDLLLFH